MPEEFTRLAEALKTLPIPFAENEWYQRPNDNSYGIVSLDFEQGALNGDGLKLDTVYEGSVDLFSKTKGGAGWVKAITDILTEHCGSCWSLNSHMYERETGLFHWEWTFEVM
jgi:hypothetical protein